MTSRIDKKICGCSFEDFLDEIKKFHGHMAPGLVLGGFMVDWGQELIRINMGTEIEADAIVETRHCLPDAIQIFTPCTIGNGWMKILEWDKFALCLYDKKVLSGYRIWLDLAKARQFPNLYNWYMRRVSKKDLPLEVLLGTIIKAQRRVLSYRRIHVMRFYEPQKKAQIAICSGCGEAYPVSQGAMCLTCLGAGYYEPLIDQNVRPSLVISAKKQQWQHVSH